MVLPLRRYGILRRSIRFLSVFSFTPSSSASGGFHHGKPEDHSVPFLRSILGFMGVEDFESIVLEGRRSEQLRDALR